MKKFLVLCLLVVYGLASSGMTVQFHYCCGRLKNIELRPVEQTGCKHGLHKMKNKKCCENKSVELKVKTDQKAEQVTALKFFKYPTETKTYFPDHIILTRISRQLSPIAFAPPPDPSARLFILHCVYRI